MHSPDEWDVPLGLKLLSVCRLGGGGEHRCQANFFAHRPSDARLSADVNTGASPPPRDAPAGDAGAAPDLRSHLGPAECEISISTSELCMSGLKNASCESNADGFQAGVRPGWQARRRRDNFYQAHSRLATVFSKHAAVVTSSRGTQRPKPVRNSRGSGRVRLASGSTERQLTGLLNPFCSQTREGHGSRTAQPRGWGLWAPRRVDRSRSSLCHEGDTAG